MFFTSTLIKMLVGVGAAITIGFFAWKYVDTVYQKGRAHEAAIYEKLAREAQKKYDAQKAALDIKILILNEQLKIALDEIDKKEEKANKEIQNDENYNIDPNTVPFSDRLLRSL